MRQFSRLHLLFGCACVLKVRVRSFLNGLYVVSCVACVWCVVCEVSVPYVGAVCGVVWCRGFVVCP